MQNKRKINFNFLAYMRKYFKILNTLKAGDMSILIILIIDQTKLFAITQNKCRMYFI